jgi:hypothetical protein
MPDPRLILVSGHSGAGIEQWQAWLEELRLRQRSIHPPGTTTHAHLP